MIDFLESWHRRNPAFTGSVELHFRGGDLHDIKTSQSHRGVLKQDEQRHKRPLRPM